MEHRLFTAAIIFGEEGTSIGFGWFSNPDVRALQFSSNHSVTLKPPTSILLDEHNEYVDYGSDAEQRYQDLCEDEEDTRYRLFKEFTRLHNSESLIPENVYVKDTHGRRLSAITIFRNAVNALTDILFKFNNTIQWDNDAQFVIVHPSVWNDTALECLKTAVFQAGLSQEQVVFASESVVTATLCQHEIDEAGIPMDGKTLSIQWQGTRINTGVIEKGFDETQRIRSSKVIPIHSHYMILSDVHKEIGIMCEQNESIIDSYCVGDKIGIVAAILRKSEGNAVKVPITFEISELLRANQSQPEHIKRIVGHTIVLEHYVAQKIVDKLLTQCVAAFKDVIEKERDVSQVILFGDMPQYHAVSERVRKELNIPVSIPRDVSTAGIRGAITYGKDPRCTVKRIIRSCWYESETQMKEQIPAVVAAIDFGTTYSGYAYTYKSEFDNEYDASIKRIWTGTWSSDKALSPKAPTTVLVTPENDFSAFGYEAETMYADLNKDEGYWKLFRRFKMTLHGDETLNLNTEISDIRGEKTAALTIFSMVIRFLKGKLLERIAKSKENITDDDVLFMLTVPAIWGDAAKQFMKEAAFQAGIDPKRVKLALEPEAAAAFCQYMKTDVKLSDIAVGQQFMVADLGGGTADFSILEKLEHGKSKEVYRANGVPSGGKNVDDNFLGWIAHLSSYDTIDKIKTNEPEDFLALESEFEFKKRDIKQTTRHLTIRLPASFLVFHEKVTGSPFDETLKRCHVENLVLDREKLRIPMSEIRKWFYPVIESISSRICKILDDTRCRGVKIVIAVGGFSSCYLLQESLQTIFSARDIRVFFPEDPELAVLKGAVITGLNPHFMAARILRFSYGISKHVLFKEDVHDRSMAQQINGQLMVNLFERFVEVDEEIDIGLTVSKGFVPTQMRSSTICIYSSSKPRPKYVTEEGCRLVGRLTVDHPEGTTLEEKQFEINFVFGRSEMSVKVKRQRDGKEFCSTLSFL